jgi:hypothetical protein
MDQSRSDLQLDLPGSESPPSATESLRQAEDAFARVIEELELGKWALRRWAGDLGITDDEMLIEVDRRLHHSPAA